MIGGIKTGTLEDNAKGEINLAQGFLAAFRANLQWLFAKFLLAVELHTAIFTPISVDGHKSTSNLQRTIVTAC